MLEKSCIICDNNNPRILTEFHHFLTRARIDKTIILCKNCHGSITAIQEEFPSFARDNNAPKELRRIYKKRTIGALLKVIGEEMIKDSSVELEEFK